MADDDRTPPTPATARAGASTALAGVAAGVADLAVLHPVLEALGRHPEFFVARATPRTDALVVAAALALVLPGVIWVVVAVAGHWRPVAATVVAGAVLATSAASFALQVLPGLPVGAVLLGAVVGVGLTVAVGRAPGSWPVVRWGVAVPVLSLAFFLVGLPASRVVWGSADLVAPAAAAQDPVPVVVVVFDELPAATLMEGPDEVDADRFPSFAAFADDAVWYRNATTVTDRTSGALPSILTGQRPEPGELPIAADHPQSLFSLLADTHDVVAVEPVTDLCPAQVCDPGTEAVDDAEASVATSTPAGFGVLLDDVRLVGLHVLLPSAWTEDLAPIDQTWGDFGDAPGDGLADDADGSVDGDVEDGERFDLWDRAEASSAGDRSADFRGVIEPPADRPPAYVLHTMLPHVPYRFLPTGQATTPVRLAGLTEEDTWSDDTWLREHAHRQHLLQTGVVDRMLGEVLDDLRASGVYDDAMIVVAADHGVAFREGHHRRQVDRETLPAIAAVPMMVRYPDGPHGEVDDRPVETIDLVPTVVDLLGIEVAEPLDGTSLLDEGDRPQTRTIHSMEGELSFQPDEADPWLVGARVQDRFGGDWDALYASVPHSELVGREVVDMEVETATNLVVVDHRARLRRATPTSSPIVSVLSGGLGFHDLPDGHVHVAVAFDGTIVAVGRTIEQGDDTAAFHALLDPSWYAREVDPIEVYRILDDDRLRGPLHDPELVSARVNDN